MLSSAKDILGYDLLELCLQGPEAKLEETRYCQPAMFVAGLAAVEQLKSDKSDHATRFEAAAGLSLGEYTALCAAGAFTFEDPGSGFSNPMKRWAAFLLAAQLGAAVVLEAPSRRAAKKTLPKGLLRDDLQGPLFEGLDNHAEPNCTTFNKWVTLVMQKYQEDSDVEDCHLIPQWCYASKVDKILPLTEHLERDIRQMDPRLKYVDLHHKNQHSHVVKKMNVSCGCLTPANLKAVQTVQDGLKLVALRGQAMQDAASVGKQAMLSVAGFEKSKLVGLCEDARKSEGPEAVCQIANELFPKGFSCAGTDKAIQKLKDPENDSSFPVMLLDGATQELADEGGALQAKVLKTSGGFHTSLMAPAKAKLGQTQIVRATHPGWQVLGAEQPLPVSIVSYFEVQILHNPDTRGGLAIGVCDHLPSGPETHSIHLQSCVLYNSNNGLLGDCIAEHDVKGGLMLAEGERLGISHDVVSQTLQWYHNGQSIGKSTFRERALARKKAECSR
eukprot:g21017.t1